MNEFVKRGLWLMCSWAAVILFNESHGVWDTAIAYLLAGFAISGAAYRLFPIVKREARDA